MTTFKQVRQLARSKGGTFIGIFNEEDLGWYATRIPDQRSIFYVGKTGAIKPCKSEFAKNWISENRKK